MVHHEKLRDERNAFNKHSVQILRSAQDDRPSMRCHPEGSEGTVYPLTDRSKREASGPPRFYHSFREEPFICR